MSYSSRGLLQPLPYCYFRFFCALIHKNIWRIFLACTFFCCCCWTIRILRFRMQNSESYQISLLGIVSFFHSHEWMQNQRPPATQRRVSEWVSERDRPFTQPFIWALHINNKASMSSDSLFERRSRAREFFSLAKELCDFCDVAFTIWCVRLFALYYFLFPIWYVLHVGLEIE